MPLNTSTACPMLVIFFASWINIVQKKIFGGFFVIVVNVGTRHRFQRGSIEVLHRRGAQLIVLRLDIVACSSCSTSTGAPRFSVIRVVAKCTVETGSSSVSLKSTAMLL